MKAVTIALLSLLIGVVLLASHTASPSDQFELWKQKYSVQFDHPADEFYRRSIFEVNLAAINDHNSNPANTYLMGVNQFTIYTQQEFQEMFLGLTIGKGIPSVELSDPVEAVIIDWTKQGAVGPIRVQGLCGSGVLYSAVEAVEGLAKITTEVFKSFSSQQLKDCVFGCQGSDIAAGFNYYKTHSACTQAEYPEGFSPVKCVDKQCAFTISNYYFVDDCDSVVSVIKRQPIAVAVDATNWSSYSSGIFNNCGKTVNHMVLLTGMADEYWKCKNSWGAWGENGYIRLAPGNTCGVCSYGSYPIH